jgi:hypothetical protein
MPAIPAIQEAETGRSWSEAHSAKGNMKSYLKNKIKAKELRG